MKEIPLTRGYVGCVDDEDYDRIACHKWSVLVVKSNRYGKQVYGCRKKDGKFVYLHREILGITDSSIQVDHRDHDGLNCQKRNLRIATHSQNMSNRRVGLRNTSGVKGVYWNKQKSKWHARITVNYRVINLGFFDSLNAAKNAYDRACIVYHGEFACLNASAA